MLNYCFPRNETQEEKHWYISYLRYSQAYGSDTTSLVLGQMEFFFILNGDHRDALNKAIEEKPLGTTKLSACLKYVMKHKDQFNKYSDTLE